MCQCCSVPSTASLKFCLNWPELNIFNAGWQEAQLSFDGKDEQGFFYCSLKTAKNSCPFLVYQTRSSSMLVLCVCEGSNKGDQADSTTQILGSNFCIGIMKIRCGNPSKVSMKATVDGIEEPLLANN